MLEDGAAVQPHNVEPARVRVEEAEPAEPVAVPHPDESTEWNGRFSSSSGCVTPQPWKRMPG